MRNECCSLERLEDFRRHSDIGCQLLLQRAVSFEDQFLLGGFTFTQQREFKLLLLGRAPVEISHGQTLIGSNLSRLLVPLSGDDCNDTFTLSIGRLNLLFLLSLRDSLSLDGLLLPLRFRRIGAAGSFGVTLFRPLSWFSTLPGVAATSVWVNSFGGCMALPPIEPDACLMPVFFVLSSSNGVRAELSFVEG